LGEPKLRKTSERMFCLLGFAVLAIFLSSAAGAATSDDADRLLQGPDLDKEKAVKALGLYENLLPPAGTQRLPVLERLARTSFIVGDIAESGQRRLYYEQGRQYAEKILQEFPQNVAGHYWLGLNLGGLADVNRLQGRKLLPQILEELERAASINPGYDQGGAYRVLGRIYYSAPGRPFSVGDINKSLDLLQKATALTPSNSTNHLYLAETLLKLGRQDQARKELQQVMSATQNSEGQRGLEADKAAAKELMQKSGL
jgi:tetratricopeptide (TPR) repeat protein